MPLHFIDDLQRTVSKGNIKYTGEILKNPEKHINLYIGNGLIGACIDYLGSMNNFSGEKSISETYISHKLHYTKACYGMEFRVPLIYQTIDLLYNDKSFLRGDFTIGNYRQFLDIYTGILNTEYDVYDGEELIAGLKIKQNMNQSLKNLFLTNVKVEPAPEHRVELRIEYTSITEYTSHYDYPYKGRSFYQYVKGFPCLNIDTGAVSTKIVVISREDATGMVVPRNDPAGMAISRKDAAGTFIPRKETAGMVFPPNNAAGSASPRMEVNDSLIRLRYDISALHSITTGAIVVSDRDDMDAERAVEAFLADSCVNHILNNNRWWKEYWQESMLSFECDYPLMEMWLRANYFFAITESSTKSVPVTPGGLSGSKCWPFIFPQDYFYIYQNYLPLNHRKLAEATSTYWYETLEDVLDYTQRLLKTKGAFYPWSTAYFDYKSLHRDGVPNIYYYELHNSAYVLEMCYQYYLYTKDFEYLKNYGYPVIKEIANLYSSISVLNPETNKYEITFTPNMGQDEAGGFNSKNYFCTLTSAAYSLKIAVEVSEKLGIPPDDRWVDINKKGYCFDKLIKDGKFVTNEEVQAIEGTQKHPVQLNPLAYLPIEALYKSEAFINTYYSRYDLVDGARDNCWSGWTLGEFLLASVRMRDSIEAERDFNNLYNTAFNEYQLFDESFIQMYESSRASRKMNYYITTHGLLCRAITELFVQVHEGVCDILPVLLPSIQKHDSPVIFENINTPFGYSVSGKIHKGEFKVIINNVSGKTLSMRVHNVTGRFVLMKDGGRITEFTAGELINVQIEPGCRYCINKL